MLDLLLLDGLPRDAECLLYGLLRRVVVRELTGVVKDQRRVLPVPLFHQQTLVLTVQTDPLRSGSFFCDFILFWAGMQEKIKIFKYTKKSVRFSSLPDTIDSEQTAELRRREREL